MNYSGSRMRLAKPINDFNEEEVKEICDTVYKIHPGLLIPKLCKLSYYECHFVGHQFCPKILQEV